MRGFLAYLKNKKVIVTVLSILLITGVYFVFIKEKKPTTIYEKQIAKLIPHLVSLSGTTDSDGDGLMDWEEVLWKTDPLNSDSDSDGYSDKEETTKGYNPIKDSSNPDFGILEPVILTTSEHFNLTENLAKSIGNRMKESPQLKIEEIEEPLTMVDKETSQGLLQFMNNFNPQISENEINISSDNSSKTIGKYLIELGTIISQKPDMSKTDDEIFTEAMQTGNFKEIDQQINIYENIITEMKNVIIPSQFADSHKKLTESFMAMKIVCQNIKEIHIDPLKTILALEEYSKINQKIAEFFSDLAVQAEKHYE
ncbi:thrombospondin type 3 repeat-containing protein [Patescibacteria group bacterium]